MADTFEKVLLKKVLLKKVLRDEVMSSSVRQKSGRDGRGTSRSHPVARVAQTGFARSPRSSRALSGFAETSPGSCAGFRRARSQVRLRPACRRALLKPLRGNR